MFKPKDIDNASFWGKSNKTKRTDWGSCFIPMDESIKDSGKTITSKVKGMRNLPIRRCMMALMSRENHMGMGSINGRTVKFIKGNGLTG